MIDFRELVKKGVHFGHQTSRWCPKMAPYIWGSRGKTHLINVAITAYKAEKAAQFIENLAADGQIILWVGTKKSAQKIIEEISQELGMPGVYHRWIGGIISNFGQIKKSVTKMLHYEDVLANASKHGNYTKKELNTIQKMVDRLNKSVGGLRKLVWPIGAVVIVDVNKERSALLEATQMGVPVVALVDTNCDPSLVDYVVPGNDDAPDAIAIILNYFKDAAHRGMAKANNKATEQAIVDTQEERSIEAGAAVLTLDTEEEEQQPAQQQKKPRKIMAAAKSSIPGASRKLKASQSDD